MQTQTLMQTVRQLRWDDHRYYHQSRINQTLHLVSAVSFLIAYVMLFVDPAASGLIGWLVGMVTRQSGHIFFEPRGYDAVNRATDEYKERIKVGYNMRRKGIIIGIWVTIAVLIAFVSQLGSEADLKVIMHRIGMAWLLLGVAGVIFRMGQLLVLRDSQVALAWAVKILTDPFHNIAIYWKSPIALLRGEMLDPIIAEEPIEAH